MARTAVVTTKGFRRGAEGLQLPSQLLLAKHTLLYADRHFDFVVEDTELNVRSLISILER
jgi:hypothetical protein